MATDDPKPLSNSTDYFASLAYRARAPETCVCGALCVEPGRCAGCASMEREAARGRRAIEATIASIPHEFQWACFGAPELPSRVRDRRAIELARRAVTEAESVILSGTSGSGKTSLAVAIMRDRSEQTRTRGRFFSATRIGVARTQTPLGTGEAKIVAEAMSAPLAIVDDVGSERDARDNALADVVFERHAAGHFTLWTTGFPREALVQRYGDGVARRMTERSVLIRVTPAGSDS